MKILEIPENTNDLRDYNHFIKVISEIQEFNTNIEIFLKKVLFDEFYKTVGEWKKIIKPEDLKQIEILFADAVKTKDFNIIEIKNEIKKLKSNISDLRKEIKDGKNYSTLSKEEINILNKEINSDKNKIEELELELYCKQDPSLYDNVYIFYCYETNKFSKPEHYRAGIYWSHIGKDCISKIKPSKDGMKINLIFEHTYKESPWPGWLPTFHASIEYQIDLLKKSVKEINQNLRETSNKRY